MPGNMYYCEANLIKRTALLHYKHQVTITNFETFPKKSPNVWNRELCYGFQ
jgi:hypothetical protein